MREEGSAPPFAPAAIANANTATTQLANPEEQRFQALLRRRGVLHAELAMIDQESEQLKHKADIQRRYDLHAVQEGIDKVKHDASLRRQQEAHTAEIQRTRETAVRHGDIDMAQHNWELARRREEFDNEHAIERERIVQRKALEDGHQPGWTKEYRAAQKPERQVGQ